VLGVACHERPPRVVCRTLEVTHGSQVLAPCRVALVLNREQGNGGAGKARQVALTKLCEGLEGNSLHGVIEVVTGGRGEPGRHARVRRVSQDVHVDLAVSTPELTVRTTMVRGSPRVAETVKQVPKQGWKAGTVQPVATEPSVGPEGGVGVVIHLSEARKNESTFHPLNRDIKPELKRNHHDNTSTQILLLTGNNLAKLGCVKPV
jgi:hypothetical protein